MEIVFWQNILSPHQSALTRALVEAGHDITVVAAEEMTSDRRRMGWKVPDFGWARLIIEPGEKQIESIVRQGSKEVIHIMGGARWKPLGDLATACCIRSGRRMGIMSEAANNGGWRGVARWVKYTRERFTRGRNFDFILAMGATGIQWFTKCAYPERRIFPFAYITEPASPSQNHRAGSNVHRTPRLPLAPYDILFLGQCIPRKGVDVLLAAVSACSDLYWNLTILGEGESKPQLEAIALAGAGRDRIRFLPAMDNHKAMQHLQDADLLVLPSRFDGWGAVVNEALMRGVPVICSNRCGAADLLRADWRGEVFAAGSVSSLAGALRRQIARGKKSPETSARIKDWSCCIEGHAAGRYLEAILNYVYNAGIRPEAPWRLLGTDLVSSFHS